MSREIKFKAVEINTGKWLESTTIAKRTINRKRNNYYFEIAENRWVGVIPESLGQFTGKKDINGIDIYEGDILHYEGITSFGEQIKEVVSYSTERAQFMVGLNPMSMYHVTPKIIGNTYTPILTNEK